MTNCSVSHISLSDLDAYLESIIIQHDRGNDINSQNGLRKQYHFIEWIEYDNDEEVINGPFKRGIVNGISYYFLQESNKINPNENLDISINHLSKPILRRSNLYAVQSINESICFVKASR